MLIGESRHWKEQTYLRDFFLILKKKIKHGEQETENTTKRHDRDWLNPEDETEEWVEDNSHISNFIMQEDECRDE